MELAGTKLTFCQEAIHALQQHGARDDGPLFSLMVRTVGDRPDLLQEALCSVLAQTEQSFEVLVLLHSPDREPPVDAVTKTVQSFPAFFQEKVRVIVVKRPGRSAPLNDGIDRAKGRMMCILDDDDLLYENHFSCIADALSNQPMTHVYQTYASRRHISVLTAEPGATFPYTTTLIETAYTAPFDAGEQLRENFVPSCNFFFSRQYANALKLRFDESLEVLEDWKFLMDINRFSDVTTVPVVTTAIGFRANNTNTVCNPALDDLWAAARTRIKSKILSEPRILSANELKHLSRTYELLEKKQREVDKLKEDITSLLRIVQKMRQILMLPVIGVWRVLPIPMKLKIKRLLRRS